MSGKTETTPGHPEECQLAMAESGARERQLAAEVRALTRLHEASSRLWEMRSLDEGLNEMLAATMELLGADFGNVQLYDARRGVLTIAVHNGFGPDFLDAFRAVGVQDDSACGRALREGQSVLIEDIETDAPFAPLRPIARAAGYRAVLSTPLKARDGAPLGMISVHFRAPHRPDEGERRAVVDYAQRAAEFIERCRIEEALSLKEEHLRVALRAAKLGTWSHDLETDELTLSADCRRLLGFPAEGMIDFARFFAIVHPDDRPRLRNTTNQVITHHGWFELEYRILPTDGSSRWVRSSAQVRYSAAGLPLSLDGVVGDITERKQSEEALAGASRRLVEAQAIAHLGSYDYDVATRQAVWSEEEYRIFGMDPAGPPPAFEDILARVHPDDAEATREAYEAALAIGTDFEHEHRLLLPDGRQRWVRDMARPRHDARGQIVRFIGTTLDITPQKLAELALQAERDRLAALIDCASDEIWLIDRTGRVLLANAAARQAFALEDFSDESVLALAARLEILRPDGSPRPVEESPPLRALRGNRVDNQEELVRLPSSGEWRWRFVNATPIQNSGNEITGVVTIVRDITATRQADAELIKMRLLLEEGERIAHLGSWEYDVATRRTTWSAEECRIYGLKPGDPSPDYAAMLRDCIHPEDAGRLDAAFQEALRRQVPYELENRIVRPDGSIRIVRDLAQPHFGAAGALVKYIGTTLDITELRNTEATLRTSEANLRLASEGAQIGIWYWNLVTDRFDWSPRCREHLALPEGAELSYAHFLAVLHPDDRERTERVVQAALAEHHDFVADYRVVRPDGGYRWIEGLGRGEWRADGQPIGMRGITLDITQRKQAEIELEEKRQQLRLFIEHAPAALAMFDRDMRYLSWSRRWLSDYGLGERDLTGLSVYAVFPEISEEWKALHRRGLEGEHLSQREDRFVRQDGRVQWLRWELLPWRRADGAIGGLLLFSEDITRQKEAQDLLRDSEERFRLAMDATRDGLWDWNLQTGQCTYSPGYFRMLDLEPGDFPAHVDTWIGLLHPDEREAIVVDARRRLATDGEYEIEYRLRHRLGDYIWVSSRGRVVERDAEGRPLRAIGTHVDITERRRILEQLAELNRDLERKVAERTAQVEAANAAKSRFLAHMSHEIRTPMNAVLGLAQLLAEEPLEPGQLAMIRHIREAGENLLRIINDILDFSKIEAGQLELENRPFDLHSVLTRVEQLLAASARRKNLDLRVEATAPPGWLVGDALRLEQVLINLAGNGIKFTDRGGVTLRVGVLTLEEGTAHLRFEVEDTGIGMTEEARARLFQPFTQTDASITRRFGGTGLGLSICKRLVELMGGRIGVESREGAGSTFWFELTFPRCEAAPPAETAPVAGPRLAGLRILVADDNGINLMLAERVLKKEGAEVTTTRDGQQALDRLRESPGAFDLVLMDIQMPVMDGLTATRAIRADSALAGLPVIALTAGVLPEERQAALEAGVNDFLPKPLDLHRMAEMIRGYCPPTPRD